MLCRQIILMGFIKTKNIIKLSLNFQEINKNIKMIAMTATNRYPLMNEHTFGTPAPPSYVPLGISGLTDEMTFLERVGSFLEHNIIYNVILRDPVSAFEWIEGMYMIFFFFLGGGGCFGGIGLGLGFEFGVRV